MNPTTFYPHVYESLLLTLPIVMLLISAILVLAADVMLPRESRGALPWIAGIGVLLSFIALIRSGVSAIPRPAYGGALVVDRLTFIADAVVLGSALYLIAISTRWLRGRLVPHGEYYALLLFATMAMMALGHSNELLALFLNFELLSITFYILLGIEKRNARSTEAGFKYFIVGSLAAAFLLMGIVFIFGATGGETHYGLISQAARHGVVKQPLFLAAGLGLLFIGFAFKITLAPFHMYAPDVYDGAPTPIVAALATGAKVAGFTALYHIVEMVANWKGMPAGVWIAFYAIVVASMVVGNVGAVVQPNIKRLLAYSSIAHSGYTMIPLAVVLAVPGLLPSAQDAVGYYLIAYTIMTLLAFGVISSLGPQAEGPIAAWAGLGRRARVRAAFMALAMLSLIGLPPTVGFFGKIGLFGVAVDGSHIWLAVVGILASVVSVSYYLRVVITMYMSEPVEGVERPAVMNRGQAVALAIGAACVLAFAVLPWLNG